jgi:flavin-dependent dehydrogenase
MFDVIVCGAGPAGALAATVLARGGARVLMLDRARFPRPKLCGDTINPGARAVLQRLGLAAAIETRALEVDGMIVSGEGGVRVSAGYGADARGLAIERTYLDAALANAAVAAGARFEDGVLVRGPLVDERDGVRVRGVILAGRDGKDLRVPAPIVIAADGRRSRLAVPLRLIRQPAHPRRWAIGAYFEGIDGLTTFGEMHVRRGRYIGIAPVPPALGSLTSDARRPTSDGRGPTSDARGATSDARPPTSDLRPLTSVLRANVCVVVPGTVAMRDPAAVLRDAISRDAHLRDRFTHAELVSTPAVIGPLAVDASHAGMPGLLLAGDAAGFIDPMTGDGLRFAFRGGELAAAVSLAALEGRIAAPHERLAGARRREFGSKWRFNRSLRSVVEHDLSVALAARAARVAPWLLRRTIAFAGDLPR